MVKRARDQSADAPIASSWATMPCPSSSLPRPHARLEEGRAAEVVAGLPLVALELALDHDLCVAIPAWSTPGSQSAASPRIRWVRTRMSWMVTKSACPMWSEPVTLGGGITTYAGRPLRAASRLGVNTPASCHRAYHRDSAMRVGAVGEVVDCGVCPTTRARRRATTLPRERAAHRPCPRPRRGPRRRGPPRGAPPLEVGVTFPIDRGLRCSASSSR